jgi:Polyketide cyclase / dehydrase and lipid transport
MTVVNCHSRRIAATPDRVRALMDTLGSPDDRLWPRDRWPAMRFDQPLQPGARGGHGPIRYTVELHQPGRLVRFRFTAPRGVHGFHEIAVRPDGDGTILQLRLVARLTGPARLTWPLGYRWLHDALIEDLLDQAEHALAGRESPAAHSWPWHVRALRRLASTRQPKPVPDQTTRTEPR